MILIHGGSQFDEILDFCRRVMCSIQLILLSNVDCRMIKGEHCFNLKDGLCFFHPKEKLCYGEEEEEEEGE